MKHLFMTAIMAAVIGFTFVSCGSKKKLAVAGNEKEIAVVASNEKEISVPCDDLSSTDANYFRGHGVGQSKDLSTAREKARMTAIQELSTSISVLSKRVAERYVNDAGQKPEDYSETFESLTREVVRQQVNNLRISCNKSAQTTDGMFKVYMAVEANKDNIFESLNRRVEAAKAMETIYNREKFRRVFEEEMENYSKEQ